jgi:hypothetical protein
VSKKVHALDRLRDNFTFFNTDWGRDQDASQVFKVSYSNLLPDEIPYGVLLGMTTQLSI